jgi:hypothetical protein
VKKLSVLIVFVSLGAVLSSCNGQDSGDSESTAKAVVADLQVTEDLRIFCTLTTSFAGLPLARVEDVAGDNTELLAAVATEPSFVQFVEPIKAFREYVAWADQAMQSIQTTDAVVGLLTGKSLDEAFDSNEKNTDFYRTRFSLSQMESAVRSYPDIVPPPVTAKNLESDLLVACASFNS